MYNIEHTEYSTMTKSIYDLLLMNFDFGLKDYPIWNEGYRTILNTAILDFYKFKQIGYTNPAVFKDRLNMRMSLIMRNKYNALYEAKAKEFNPLYTLEVYEEYSHELNNTGQSSNNGTVDYTTNNTSNVTTNSNSKTTNNEENNQSGESMNVTSQYPSEEMLEENFEETIYVDGGAKVKNSQKSVDESTQNLETNGTVNNVVNGTDKTVNVLNGTSNNKVIESYNKKTYGSASDLSFAHAMTQFKDYIIQFQLDNQVIDELKDLFLNVW